MPGWLAAVLVAVAVVAVAVDLLRMRRRVRGDQIVSDLSEMRFLLEITLGEDGMLSGQDVADALRGVADELDGEGIFQEPLLMDTVLSGVIEDVYGGPAGRWAVKSLSAEQAERQVAW